VDVSFPHLPARETHASLPYSQAVEDWPARRERRSLRVLPGALRSGAARALALWHLMSLDAVTVAVVWSAAFAWTAGVRVPAWALAMQALAVWAVYVGDRLLDARAALRTRDLERLRERHFFHWRHRRVLRPAAGLAACAAAGLILIYMPAMAQVRSATLAGAALMYFARVHSGAWDEDGARGRARRTRRLWKRGLPTKEMLVGVLFTAGCALPAMGRMPSAARGTIFCVVSFFALLAWLNCRAIERWEGERREGAARSGVTRERAGWRADWVVAGVGLAMAAILAAHERAAVLLLMGALSAMLLAWLDGRRSRMSPVMLRAAADLVLLTPVVLLLLARMGR